MKKSHWTERSIKDYRFRIVADFFAQLEKKMELLTMTQNKFAKKLKLTKGRVSQIFNDPGNITLDNIVKFARTLGMKISLVAYEDGDPKNERGPIDSEIFQICWEKLGKPRDFWVMQEIAASNRFFDAKVTFGRRASDVYKMFDEVKMSREKKGTLSDIPGCPSFVTTEKSAWNETVEDNKPS